MQEGRFILPRHILEGLEVLGGETTAACAPLEEVGGPDWPKEVRGLTINSGCSLRPAEPIMTTCRPSCFGNILRMKSLPFDAV